MSTTNDREDDQPMTQDDEPRRDEPVANTVPAPTWAQTPGVEPIAHGTAPAGAPATEQPWGAWATPARSGPRPKWQLPVGIGVGALLVVAGAGFGGFAIGHSVGGGSGSTQQTVPNGQFPGGAPSGFPAGPGGTGGGDGTGGSNGTGGFGSPNGSGTSGSGTSDSGTSGSGTSGSGTSGSGTGGSSS